MNSRIIAVLVFVLPFISLFSQETGNKIVSDSVRNSLYKGKLAFQYESGFNFSKRSIIPIIFSLKYQLSDKSALRLSVGLSPGNKGIERRRSNDTINYNSHFDGHGNNNIETMNVSLNYMIYPAPRKEINLFFGLGPRFGIGMQHFSIPNANNTEPDSSRGQRNTSWSIGLAGLVGLEWFATRSISFFTEYDVSGGYQKRDYWDADYNAASGTYTITEVKSNKIRMTDLSARLGLSIYFDKPF